MEASLFQSYKIIMGKKSLELTIFDIRAPVMNHRRLRHNHQWQKQLIFCLLPRNQNQRHFMAEHFSWFLCSSLTSLQLEWGILIFLMVTDRKTKMPTSHDTTSSIQSDVAQSADQLMIVSWLKRPQCSTTVTAAAPVMIQRVNVGSWSMPL